MNRGLTPMSAPIGTLRRATRGGALLGLPFVAFSLLAWGIAVRAGLVDLSYRHDALHATATVVDKLVHRASAGSTSSKYLVRYRFVAADGSTQFGSRELPFDEWNALQRGAALQVSYLADRPYESRVGAPGHAAEFLGWGSFGLLFGVAGFLLIYVPLRRAAFVERLLQEGSETVGTVEHVGDSGWVINRRRMWRVTYSYGDSNGVAHTGRSALQPQEAARVWKKGETGPVRYDRGDSRRSIWVAWP